MDLYRIALIFLAVAILAVSGAAFLNWIEGRRDPRARERQAREALARANNEVSRRPRVPAVSSPLPTLERTQ